MLHTNITIRKTIALTLAFALVLTLFIGAMPPPEGEPQGNDIPEADSLSEVLELTGQVEPTYGEDYPTEPPYIPDGVCEETGEPDCEYGPALYVPAPDTCEYYGTEDCECVYPVAVMALAGITPLSTATANTWQQLVDHIADANVTSITLTADITAASPIAANSNHILRAVTITGNHTITFSGGIGIDVLTGGNLTLNGPTIKPVLALLFGQEGSLRLRATQRYMATRA